MTITVKELNNIWTALKAIYEANEVIPSKFDYLVGERMLPILAKEMAHLERRGEEGFQQILDAEIEIPITKIDPSILPENMPNNITTYEGTTSAMRLLSPILKQAPQPEHESAIAKLLEEQKEGEKENGKEAAEEIE